MVSNYNISEKLDYYKKIGLTDEQSVTLSIIPYGIEIELLKIMDAFNKSKFKSDNIRFCQLVYSIYIENEDISFEDMIYTLKSKLGLLDKVTPQNKEANYTDDNDIDEDDASWLVHEQEYCVNEDESLELCDITGISYSCLSEDLCLDTMIAEFSESCLFELCEDSPLEDDTCMDGTSTIGLSCKATPIKINTGIHLVDYLDSKANIVKKVMVNPTSTFKPTTSKASLDMVMANINDDTNDSDFLLLDSGIRVEEILNYADYNLEKPDNNNKFKITTELMDTSEDNKTLFVGIQGTKVRPEKQNIVILLDTSGSMLVSSDETQMAIMTIVSKLNNGDKFSLIAYSDNDTLVIDNITINENSVDFIIERLYELIIDGCTNGSGALDNAYEIIKANMIDNGINRVVLITDGDFNFSVNNDSSIVNIEKEVEKIVLEYRNNNAYMSVIGCGYIINDNIMSNVARNGNGNYCFIYDIKTIDKNINNNYNGLVFPIAKDVKAQLEFNPAVVESYKLIGYETRVLNNEEFRDDKVVAEPFGSGEQSVAIYELQMNKDKVNKSPFKYQRSEYTNKDEICTVYLRYKDIEDEEVKQIEHIVMNDNTVKNDNCKKACEIYKNITERNLEELIKTLNEDK